MLNSSEFSIIYWYSFLLLFIICFFINKYFIIRKAQTPKVNILSTIFWLICSVVYMLILKVLFYSNLSVQDHSNDFFTGYLIELSLSIDNVFVFIMLFSKLQISQQKQHIILEIGIISAIIMRFFMILFAIDLIRIFVEIFYVFGTILVITALSILFSKQKTNVQAFYSKYFIRCAEDNFFIRQSGKIRPTINLLALILIEKADLMFALDSIPAVLSITQDTFIVFTSNIVAIAGLRSLFFCLSHASQQFYYLKYGCVLILLFIGIKLILLPLNIHVPNIISLSFILIILLGSIIISKFYSNDKKTI